MRRKQMSKPILNEINVKKIKELEESGDIVVNNSSVHKVASKMFETIQEV
jgi:hypothetical protein